MLSYDIFKLTFVIKLLNSICNATRVCEHFRYGFFHRVNIVSGLTGEQTWSGEESCDNLVLHRIPGGPVQLLTSGTDLCGSIQS